MRHTIFGTIPVTSVTLGHSGMSRCMCCGSYAVRYSKVCYNDVYIMSVVILLFIDKVYNIIWGN